MSHLTRSTALEAASMRHALMLRTGSLQLGALPLWETDDVVPQLLILVWGRDPRDAWATNLAALARPELIESDKPLVVPPIQIGKRYALPGAGVVGTNGRRPVVVQLLHQGPPTVVAALDVNDVAEGLACFKKYPDIPIPRNFRKDI